MKALIVSIILALLLSSCYTGDDLREAIEKYVEEWKEEHGED